MITEEFHKPFIKSLIVVGLVTLFAVISSRYIVEYYINLSYKTPIYTSSESYSEPKAPENEGISSVSQ